MNERGGERVMGKQVDVQTVFNILYTIALLLVSISMLFHLMGWG